jgi:prophage regulatory protein
MGFASTTTCEAIPVNAIQATAETSIRFLRLPEVKARTGLSGSSIYAKIAASTFPKQVAIGPNSAAWIESEIDAYNTAIVEKARSA